MVLEGDDLDLFEITNTLFSTESEGNQEAT
jgi:hypothetical protein